MFRRWYPKMSIVSSEDQQCKNQFLLFNNVLWFSNFIFSNNEYLLEKSHQFEKALKSNFKEDCEEIPVNTN